MLSNIEDNSSLIDIILNTPKNLVFPYIAVMLSLTILATSAILLVNFVYYLAVGFFDNISKKSTDNPFYLSHIWSVILAGIVFIIIYKADIFPAFIEQAIDRLSNNYLDNLEDNITNLISVLSVGVVFIVLTLIIDLTLRMLRFINTQPIQEKIRELGEQIGENIVKIIIELIDLVLETFHGILQFVRIIPDFPTTLYHFVRYEDGDKLEDTYFEKICEHWKSQDDAK